MSFIYFYVESRKLIKLKYADTDKNTKLDQMLLTKNSTWVISGKPLFIPLNTINLKYKSTELTIKIISKLVVIRR